VLAGAVHRQARHSELADVGARGLGAAQAGFVLVHLSVPRKRIGLSERNTLLLLKSAAMDGRFFAQG
jgi:hypothetical protein